MTPFTILTGTVQRVPEANIDTDVIFPARFLLITARDGLGRYAFHDRSDVTLDPAAPILVAGANFGCGSSREQAVWALAGAGIRCVIAPSFGEIFYGNCLRNGLLPIVLAEPPTGGVLTVDLQASTILDGERTIPFALPEKARLALLNGWDETALIVSRYGNEIIAFEAQQRIAQPWLWETA